MEIRPWTATHSPATDLARAAAFGLGPLTVDPSTRQISGDGRTETVEPRVMRVLVALGETPGRVFSRDELIELCWDGQLVTDNAITRVISLLRHALDDLSSGAVRIETIKKVGIRLMVEPATPQTDPGSTEAAKPAPARRRWPMRLLAALAVAGAAIAAWVAFHPGVDRTAALAAWANAQPTSERLAKPADSPNDPPRFAVLAFQPADGSEDARLVANGLAANIASALSRYDVSVVAPTSSLQIPPALRSKAGILLGADYLIDGQIVSRNGQLSVTAQLSDARKNILIYSFVTKQGTSTSDSVAEQVASHLALALNPTKISNTLGSKATPEDLALMARVNDGVETWDILNVMSLTRQLAARHPADAELQASAASSTILALPKLPESERTDALRSARKLVQRAEQLDPLNVPGQFAKELLINYEPMQMPERERLHRRAIELSPSRPEAYAGLGELMANVGRIDESVRFFQRSVQLNPLSALHAVDALKYYVQLGQLDEAKQIMEKAKILWPEQPEFSYFQYNIDSITKNYRDVVELQKKLPLPYDFMKINKEHANMMLQAYITKDRTLVRRSVENCFLDFGKSVDQGNDANCLQFMVNWGALDDAFRFALLALPDNRALYPPQDDRWLTRRVPGIEIYRLFNPNMAPFRDDPRFWPVAVRTGLVNYWQTTQKWPDFCLSQLDSCKAMAAKAAQANPLHVTASLH
jgi:DNA-binding winged helix-turn-helix (wHTH) protein/TolB-like protein